MAKHTLYDWYNDLSPTGRTIVGVAITGVTIAIGYGIWTAIAQYKKNQASLQEAKLSVDSLNQLAQTGVTPTSTDAQFEGWSNDLVQAFGGCGTDEQAVYNVFSQLQNLADLYKLIAVYGTRDYASCMWGTTSNSLSAAISDELASGEKATLNGILSQKGIAYKFA